MHRKRRILIAEENAAILEILEKNLISPKYELVTAQNGALVVKLLQQESPPDVLVLDPILPHIDGWQILKLLESPGKNSTPVIIISRTELQEKEIIEHHRCVQGYFTWPFNTDFLKEKISQILMTHYSNINESSGLKVRSVITGDRYLRDLAGIHQLTVLGLLKQRAGTDNLNIAKALNIAVLDSPEDIPAGERIDLIIDTSDSSHDDIMNYAKKQRIPLIMVPDSHFC